MKKMSIIGKIQAIHDLVKTELPLAAGVCVIAGEIISQQATTATEMILGFIVGFFLSSVAMITNDYWDIEVDRINHPTRPLPSGKVSGKELWILAFIFSAIGFTAAATLGLDVLAFSTVIWTAGILYNWKLKEFGLLGNVIVSFSVSSTFILGGIAAGDLFNGQVLLFGLIAFFFNIGEEIASNAMDIEGDAKRGARTLARMKGKNFALYTSAALFIFVVLLTFLPFLFGWMGPLYLIFVSLYVWVCYSSLILY
jgi:geranylgeranylglycerol-phosphate geranylgeranyltransferase